MRAADIGGSVSYRAVAAPRAAAPRAAAPQQRFTVGRGPFRSPSGGPGAQSRGVTADVVLAFIGFGALLCVIWPIAISWTGPAPLAFWPLVAHLFGMGAGYGVAVLIVLMARTPALERGVGADRLARWHSRGGRLVVSCIVVHAVAAVTTWATARGENLGLAFWQVLRMPWLISATVATVLFLVVAGVSIRAARRRVRFETWHSVHLLVYLAVALGFVHQLAGPDLAGHRVVQVLWALLYTQAFALVLIHRIATPLRNATHHRMRVTAVVPEGHGVVSLVIEGRDLDRLRAESGQFFRWRFLTPDSWWTAHPFSLSAPPTATHMRLTVKSLGDGSGFLQRVEPGTWVMAEGPYGAMTAQRRTLPDVLLVAGGVGITPMRALFETMPLAPGQDLLLLYRVRSRQDAIFRAELDGLSLRPGARVVYLDDAAGRFTPELFRYFVPNLAERDTYLCGPPPMAQAVRQSLRAAGLPDSQLHEERFEF
ncbi:MAG: ferric reductase [Pseudonocardiales bacterium]|nr:ferric reductase [Pseudonocardiales bacterium]